MLWWLIRGNLSIQHHLLRALQLLHQPQLVTAMDPATEQAKSLTARILVEGKTARDSPLIKRHTVV